MEHVLCHAEDAFVLQIMCNAFVKHHAQPVINVSLCQYAYITYEKTAFDSSTRMWQASDGAEMFNFLSPHLLLV